MIEKLRKLGPGLMFAGCAVGVSHVVQSTRAGALNAFDYVWIIFLIHLVKYPFFEIATRYTVVANEDLIKGYKRIGTYAPWVYLILSCVTMFIVQSAVTLVGGSLFANLFGINILTASTILLLASGIILFLGQYKILDKLIKYVIILLTLSTILAVILISSNTELSVTQTPEIFSSTGFWFLIAFMGWMPTTIDISVWQSSWVLEKQKIQKRSLKEALFDFNFGYILTAFLALCFLSLGALSMYNSGEVFSSSGIKFASQFIGMYGKSIGEWSLPIIQLAALATMFSTTITVLDGYSRTISMTLIDIGITNEQKKRTLFTVVASVLSIGSLVIIYQFISSLKLLIDIATIASFIIAPVFAWLNFKLIKLPIYTEKESFPKTLCYLSWFGLLFLISFSLIFIYMKFIS